MRAYRFILIILLMMLSSSCSKAEDFAYLTPIPETTLSAYRDDMHIESKLQAAIAAQAFLRTTRLDYQEIPIVKSVEEIPLEEAHQRMRDTRSGGYAYEDRPGNTRVWLVMLEGLWRIIPPGSQSTPKPYTHGCAYVIIDRDGHSEMGTMHCPE